MRGGSFREAPTRGGGGRRRAAGGAEEGREAAGRGKKRRADPFAPGAERVDLFRR